MTDYPPLPLDISEIQWRLLLVCGLIAINAFFVTLEFAIFSVRRSRIAQLVASGDDLAKKVQQLQRSIERLLSTAQLGITLSSLTLGWIGERAISQIFAERLVDVPIAHALAIPLTFVLLAYLQIVFGELIPKSIALIYAEPIARFLGTPSLTISRIFSPIVWLLDRSTRLCLRLLGIKDRSDYYSRMTFKELQTIVATERESSGLAIEQRELLDKVFEFADVMATAVMVPSTQIVTLPRTANCQALLIKVALTGYSRYPVIDDSLNQIVGVISFKDCATRLVQGKSPAQIPISQWIRPIEFAIESTPASTILKQMEQADTHMTILVDEFGNTAGLITRQDAIAAMTGLKVGSERPTQLIYKFTDGSFSVQAQIKIEELNEQLGLKLPPGEDYQTLAGFLLNKFQHFPQVGESLIYAEWKLTPIAIAGARIDRVKVQKT